MAFSQENNRPFIGPRKTIGKGSKLLLCDLYAFGNIPANTNAYTSAHRFRGAGKLCDPYNLPLWSSSEELSFDKIDLQLHGGYIDGHVEQYLGSKVTNLMVTLDPEGTEPDPTYGTYYIPKNSLLY